jgi:DNA modification methylase
VYDPFLGSGTTLIAAELTGRVCHALDIDPRYCDAAIERWQAFTGSPARSQLLSRRHAEKRGKAA